MAEYIERGTAIAKLTALEVTEPSATMTDAKRLLADMPAADVVPVVHGRWETNSDRPDTLICSMCKCGFDMWKHDPHNYCPNCGAKIDEYILGGQEDEVK